MTQFNIGDKFENPITGTTIIMVRIELNHWYSGSKTYGEFYTLLIEGKDKHIHLTPAMIKVFKKIN